MEYGLIGAKLGHSYSKIIHEMLCGYHYDLCPLPTEEEARAFPAKLVPAALDHTDRRFGTTTNTRTATKVHLATAATLAASAVLIIKRLST